MLIHHLLQKKVDLGSLKPDIDKLDINNLKTVPNNLNDFKYEVDKSVSLMKIEWFNKLIN